MPVRADLNVERLGKTARDTVSGRFWLVMTRLGAIRKDQLDLRKIAKTA